MEIGWAIASPLLALSGGKRTIRLVLTLRDPAPRGTAALPTGAMLKSALRPRLRLRVTTADGWLDLTGVSMRCRPAGDGVVTARVLARLAADAPAPAAPGPALGFADCAWPVLGITLSPARTGTPTRDVAVDHCLRRLVLKAVDLSVSADGLTPQRAEGCEGPVDASRAFAPFGQAPAVGARLSLVHADLFDKPLSTVSPHLPWMGVPGDLKGHYKRYFGDKCPVFQATVSLEHPAGAVEPLASAQPLFDGQNSTRPVTACWNGTFPAGRWRIALDLAPQDFGHGDYPRVAAAAIELAVALRGAGEVKAGDFVVPPPYTPMLRFLSLGFSAAWSSERPTGPLSRLFHLHPFGVVETALPGGAAELPFLPAYPDQGELYIGLSGVRPPQTLSLLFQLAEASADPGARPAPLRWSRLDAEGWRALGGDAVLDDGTAGLTRTGVLRLVLPPARPDARLPGGLYWLRASRAVGCEGVCDILGIHPNAVAVQLGGDGDAAWDGAPLPAGSITGPADPVPGVGAVRQPYPSFGGRPAEDADAFHTRASERLGHRRRALMPWDYERIALEGCPDLYKVKCLPAHDAGGTVRLVVIPHGRVTRPFDPFEPRATAAQRRRVADLLEPLMPPTARLTVADPHYVRVQVRMAVRFRGPGDPARHADALKEGIRRLLSPWADGGGAGIVMGGRIYASAIVAFAGRQPYVDVVGNIELFRSDDGIAFTRVAVSPDGDCVATTAADQVLVAAREQRIDVITDPTAREDSFQGVGYMEIGLDLTVGDDLRQISPPPRRPLSGGNDD